MKNPYNVASKKNKNNNKKGLSDLAVAIRKLMGMGKSFFVNLR